MDQFPPNIYPLINTNNNDVVFVYDQHNILNFIKDNIGPTSNGFYKSIHIDIILTYIMSGVTQWYA